MSGATSYRWTFAILLIAGCGTSLATHDIPRFGTSGQYLEGRSQFLRGRGGNMDKAVEALGKVVSDDPLYKDSLTLLGRAYYNKHMYRDAYQVLERALKFVDKEDEIAWVTLGITQLRLGEDQKGLESLKGGLTLLSGVAKSGYRDFPDWDLRGAVRVSLRRAVLLAAKGVEEKENLIRSVETLLARMDEEENLQRVELSRQLRSGRAPY